MNIIAVSLFSAAALYVVVGIVFGTLFVTLGVTRVLAQPMAVTLGARLLLLPGSILLWPLVLGRWLQSRNRQ